MCGARVSREGERLRRFIRETIRTDRGEFSFRGYRPLSQICDAITGDAEQIDIVKPTQRGFTTAIGFGFGLWQSLENGRHTAYFLPTNAMSTAVLKARFQPAINDEVLETSPKVNVQRGIVETGRGRMLWLGLETVRNVIQWPFDLNIYDEVDDLHQDNLLIARQRLDASKYAHEVAFACGRYPGAGIHGRYLLGDQRRWVVTCQSCRHEQILEDHFPENVRRIKGRWRIVCVKCGKPVRVGHGSFIPQRTSGHGDRISFQVSALAFGCTDLGRLMREWERAQHSRRELALFRSSKLGLPDAGDRQAINAEDLSRATRRGREVDPPYYAGIDVGDRCHIAVCGVLREPGGGTGPTWRFVHFDEVKGEDLVERLAHFHAQTRLAGLLIDQKPEGSLARAVCRRFPRIAFLQEFGAKEGRTEKVLDGERFRRLTMEREDAVSGLCDRVKACSVLFPDRWDGTPFSDSVPGKHLLTGSQRVETTDRHGMEMLRFRSGSVENHYLMAMVFACHVASREIGREDGVHEVRVVKRGRHSAPHRGRVVKSESAGERDRMM